jgi:hypothetical protein
MLRSLNKFIPGLIIALTEYAVYNNWGDEMPLYEFTALKADYKESPSCIMRIPSEGEAREVAVGLLNEDNFQSIEVRKGKRLVCRVGRDEAGESSSPAPFPASA